MNDQIIDAAMAQSLQVDTSRARLIVGWIVMRDPPDYPGQVTARLMTDRPTPYVLIGDSLAALQAQLPDGLTRVERQPADLSEVVEIWFPS